MTAISAWIERCFPCSFERGGPVVVALGVFSALLYVYASVWSRDLLKNLPENLLVLTFLVSAWGQRRRFRSDLIAWLLLLSFLIPGLLFAINALVDYETAEKYRSLNDLLKFFLFLPLAWWMGGSRAGAVRMLAVALLGLLTAVLIDPNLAQSTADLWAGKRVDFEIHNAQHGALLFGLVLLFSLCALERFRKRTAPAGGLVLLAAVFGTGVLGLFATQTRSAFVGLVAVALVAALRWFLHRYLYGRKPSSYWKAIFAVVLLAGLMIGFGKEIVENRLNQDMPAIELLLSGEVDEMPFTSVGIRVHSWVDALRWIAERPLTGWGLKARVDVIQLSDRFPAPEKLRFGHLHNGYLELLIAFGIPGFAFVCVLWFVLLRRIRRAASQDLYAFAVYGSVFFLALNLFESFFFYWSGIYVFALFMAGGYSQYLAAQASPAAVAGEVPLREDPPTKAGEVD